jgi:hypothetical protein
MKLETVAETEHVGSADSGPMQLKSLARPERFELPTLGSEDRFVALISLGSSGN